MQAVESKLQTETEANYFVQLPVPADLDKTKKDPLLAELGAQFYIQWKLQMLCVIQIVAWRQDKGDFFESA